MSLENKSPIPGIGFDQWLRQNTTYFSQYDDQYLGLSREERLALIQAFEQESWEAAQSGADAANYG